MGQPTLEAIMREHLAKLDCTVELGTRLFSFVQDEKCVRVKVAKHRGGDGEEVEEDIEVAYLIGADGAKGITRKQLGLTFLGTTREDGVMVLGDIRLEAKGLDRDCWHVFSPMSHDMISFRPTDELGKDGWQFFMSSRTIDLNLLRDEEALVNCLQDSVNLKDDVKVKEVMWVSDFRCFSSVLSVTFGSVRTLTPARTRPNMRMVNKLGVGRVFVAGAFLLDTYTAERLPVIVEMLGFTTELHDRTFDQLDVEHTARTTTDENSNSKKVECKFERAMRRGGKMFMLGVNYRSSPIVIDEFAPTPTSGVAVVHGAYGDGQEGVLRAGGRAPDAPGLMSVVSPNRASAGSTRMFDTFASTHHTVIIFTPALAIPVVRSVLATLDQNVPKELVRRVVVLPGSASAPDGSVEASSEVNQAIDVQVLVDHAGHAYRGYIVESQEVKIVVVHPSHGLKRPEED
ncbi:hypothetical protein EV401DRAFT_2143472 [Pisolithus croceorrhizus]|nr:hypothetical protein EV401DRAFT_2143472 [Pisolithus croceorrhizus]